MNIGVVTDPFHQNNHKSCCESFKSIEYLNLSHVNYEACEQFDSNLRTIHASYALIDREHFMRPVSIFIAYNNNKAHIDIRHSLRLNADVADTLLQKSSRQFCKYCWPNLNYGKNYICISNTFSMLKFNFFLLKSWKMLLAVPKNG